jgi:hypothetical protein
MVDVLGGMILVRTGILPLPQRQVALHHVRRGLGKRTEFFCARLPLNFSTLVFLKAL